jgi:predicted acetyltransferase
LRVCEGHGRLFDAQADTEEWELALKILRPWVQAAEPIGHDPLTRVMEEALQKAEGELRRARRKWQEAAEAAL